MQLRAMAWWSCARHALRRRQHLSTSWHATQHATRHGPLARDSAVLPVALQSRVEGIASQNRSWCMLARAIIGNKLK